MHSIHFVFTLHVNLIRLVIILSHNFTCGPFPMLSYNDNVLHIHLTQAQVNKSVRNANGGLHVDVCHSQTSNIVSDIF